MTWPKWNVILQVTRDSSLLVMVLLGLIGTAGQAQSYDSGEMKNGTRDSSNLEENIAKRLQVERARNESDLDLAAGSQGHGSRSRRSVVHLYDMVVCATGCNPLAYKGYGCYCGFLGSGLSVDGIDTCCQQHDWCYNQVQCPPLLTYFVPYYWTCSEGRPHCVGDYRGWKGVCGTHLCECDRQFAECLRKYPCPRSRAMCMTSPWRFAPEPETLYYYP